MTSEMENEAVKKGLKKAAELGQTNREMLVKTAELKGAKILQELERIKSPPTLAYNWPTVRKGFLSGYVNGVIDGFTLGYATASALAEKPEEPTEENKTQLNLPI